MFYAVYENGYEYIESVESESEFEANYGHLNATYQPRVRSFESRAEAEEFARKQNKRARKQYGR